MRNLKISQRLNRWTFSLFVIAALGTPAPEADAGASSTTALDAITRHHHPDVAEPPVRVLTVAPANGFDWDDAGIGAGGALGAALVVGGVTLLLTRNRRGTIGATS
jgi:hypothetical protein